MPGWMKAKNPGQPAREPVQARTKIGFDNRETPAVFDADNDEVYGGTWGTTTTSSPFPTGSVPAGEVTLQTVYDLLVRVAQKLNTT